MEVPAQLYIANRHECPKSESCGCSPCSELSCHDPDFNEGFDEMITKSIIKECRHGYFLDLTQKDEGETKIRLRKNFKSAENTRTR